MDERKEIDGRAAVLMVLLCIIWGSPQVALKAAAADIAPVLQIALRSGIAALLVAALMLRQGTSFAAAGAWRPGLIVGLMFGLEFVFVGEGLRFTSASHMSIFLYTAPIFVAIGLHWKLPAERLTMLQWSGIAIAFVGIVISFMGRGAGASGPLDKMWLGDLLGLAGGATWAATTIVIRLTSLSRTPATTTLFYQLAVAFALLLVWAVATGQTDVNFTTLSVSSLAYQALIFSFLSLLGWFSMLRIYLANRLGVLTFMAPLFGIGFGVWLLDESIDLSFAAGALCVIAGMLLVNGRDLVAGRKTREA